MEKKCPLEAIGCDDCMKYGTRFLGCCKLECGKHFYCDDCHLKDVYTSKQVDSDK